MNLGFIKELFAGGGVIEKALSFIPNPAEKAKALLDIERELTMAAVAANADQAEINKIEARSPHLFVAGWRPGLGWIGVITLGCNWLLFPLADWILAVIYLGTETPLPDLPYLDEGAIYPLIMGMLGMGGWRSLDKFNGRDTLSVGRKAP